MAAIFVVQFHIFAKIFGVIRIVEHNGWVFICIVAALAALAFMLVFIQRSSLREFLLQPFVDSANNFISWMITSTVFAVMLSVMLSQFVPVVPEIISKINVFGVGFSRFGAALLAVCMFYLAKSLLTYFFYACAGSSQKLGELIFSATRIYFLSTFSVITVCFINYFYPIDRTASIYLFISVCIIISVFKTLLYIFSPQQVLPSQWYNKLLYICTLQIAPILVLWKFLFL